MNRLPFFLALLSGVAAAQPAPFETLTLGVGGVATVGTAPYTDFWTPGAGVETRATTPFYLGDVTVGVTVAPHAARGDAPVVVPDDLTFYFFGVWSADLALPGGVRLAPGLHAGLFRMQFDDDAPVAVRNESELAAGPEIGLHVPVGRGWEVTANAGFARIFTSERIDLTFFRLGLGRTLRTPGWLRDLLASDG